MSEFRFSPRPNRAHEIGWESWGEAAFDRARAEDKPVLLSISAVWCHWCHVMDETTYSDPAVIASIAQRFVPVRVDNDRRPDINARYNMGGWPTTAFLGPDGALLTGATYLPPDQMRRALDDIADFYAENKEAISARAAQLHPSREHVAGADSPLDAAGIDALIATLERSFDSEYGGFGDAPKFPQADVLEFLLAEWRRSRDSQLYRMVATTILGMSRGGTYDHVEGGFFRYSTTRDWSVPHFEKMAEDHAGLLRVIAQLAVFSPTPEFRATLVSAVKYVRTVLRDAKSGLFAGSQDADEAYFALPLDERRAREAPYVDRTSYTNWTCGLAGAWFLAAFALEDDALLREACETLDSVAQRLMDDDGLAHHFMTPGETPQVRGLLTDQAAYLRALVDGHEIAGETRLLQRARELADRIIKRFEAPGGGFYDRLPIDVVGRLDVLDRPIVDNAIVADALLRLASLTGDAEYRTHAQRALQVYADTHESAGAFAASYARALRRFLSPEMTVRLVGTPAATDELREAAVRLPNPAIVVRTLEPSAAVELGLPAEPSPAAYVCAGTVCGEPAVNAAELRDRFESLRVMPAG